MPMQKVSSSEDDVTGTVPEMNIVFGSVSQRRTSRLVLAMLTPGADYKSQPKRDVETYGAELASHSGYKCPRRSDMGVEGLLLCRVSMGATLLR